MTNNAKNILLAVAGGAILGSALGVLLAPAEGSKTRRRLVGHTDELEDQVDKFLAEGKKSWKALQAEMTEASTDAESYFEHLVAEGKKALKDAKEKAENTIDEVQDTKENYVSKVAKEGKRLWNSMASKADETYDEAKEKTQETVSTLKAKANNYAEEAKQAVS
jgi:gas vesicle protein